MNPSDRLGARLGPTGGFFRVWAPHAQQVRVLIQNGPYWEDTDTVTRQDLTRGGEYWTGTVAGVQAWQLYRYKITGPGGQVFERLDPAGRDVLSSEPTRRDPSSRNGSVVVGPDLIQWSAFRTPRFADFLIYQFHIGSFAGRGDAQRRREQARVRPRDGVQLRPAAPGPRVRVRPVVGGTTRPRSTRRSRPTGRRTT